MVKLNINNNTKTKWKIPSFSITLSQLLITAMVIGLALLSFLTYINANYLIEVINNILIDTFYLFERILISIGIGSILIILWIALFICSIKSSKIRNLITSHKKEVLSLIGISIFIWAIAGILFTSKGFPGWTSNSYNIPFGGKAGKYISGYSYGPMHTALRLSVIFMVALIIAKPTAISLLSKSMISTLSYIYKTIISIFKSVNSIYTLNPSRLKEIQAPSATEYSNISDAVFSISADASKLDPLIENNTDIYQYAPPPLPNNDIQSPPPIEKELAELVLPEHSNSKESYFANPRPLIIKNEGALFNELWAGTRSKNTQEKPESKSHNQKMKSNITTWINPTLEILENSDEISITVEEIEKTSIIIKKTFAEYRIEVEVAQVRPGPTVTMYGIEPGWIRKTKRVQLKNPDGTNKLDSSGKMIVEQQEDKMRVSVDNILRREKDLSLALKTPSLRIETPVMGESLLGIEVPNPTPSLVSLRKVIQSSTFEKLRQNSVLPVALGRGSDGDEVVFDLAKMPHLLIAGATGSGKSVCMNAIISCLIMKHSPAELQMLLVDPKRVELTPYNGIPHLITPVVVETDKVVSLLKGLIQEMMDRYRIMEEIGVRNIESYNKKQNHKKMPYIVIAIDELADLMMTAAFDVEQSICRLAQLGRATGIHLIIATQRPSVDVITGLIKANFPSRISFAVTSQVDSRTILDTVGADKLLGKGDMLYQPIDMGRPTRVQSVYISDDEISKIVDYWKNVSWGYKTNIDLSYTSDETTEHPNPHNTKDSLFDEALDLSRRHSKLSTSLLQRRLRIGYPRAARLMDELEDLGIVGPSDGSKSRDVIIQSN